MLSETGTDTEPAACTGANGPTSRDTRLLGQRSTLVRRGKRRDGSDGTRTRVTGVPKPFQQVASSRRGQIMRVLGRFGSPAPRPIQRAGDAARHPWVCWRSQRVKRMLGHGSVEMPVIEHPQQSLRRELPPFPGARSHLSCAWIQHVSSAGPPYSHRALATGCVELSADLGSGRLTVSGPRQRPWQVALAPGTTLVGVRFRLGAASALLGVSTSELVEENVELADVWGHAAHDLASKINTSTSAEVAARVLAHAIAVRGREAAGVPGGCGRRAAALFDAFRFGAPAAAAPCRRARVWAEDAAAQSSLPGLSGVD